MKDARRSNTKTTTTRAVVTKCKRKTNSCLSSPKTSYTTNDQDKTSLRGQMAPGKFTKKGGSMDV